MGLRLFDSLQKGGSFSSYTDWLIDEVYGAWSRTTSNASNAHLAQSRSLNFALHLSITKFRSKVLQSTSALVAPVSSLFRPTPWNDIKLIRSEYTARHNPLLHCITRGIYYYNRKAPWPNSTVKHGFCSCLILLSIEGWGNGVPPCHQSRVENLWHAVRRSWDHALHALWKLPPCKSRHCAWKRWLSEKMGGAPQAHLLVLAFTSELHQHSQESWPAFTEVQAPSCSIWS